jgi:hypothetical protein
MGNCFSQRRTRNMSDNAGSATPQVSPEVSRQHQSPRRDPVARRQRQSPQQNLLLPSSSSEVDRLDIDTRQRRPAGSTASSIKPSAPVPSIGPPPTVMSDLKQKFNDILSAAQDAQADPKSLKDLMKRSGLRFSIPENHSDVEKAIKKWAYVHQRAQEEFQKLGFKVLVRFYVDDQGVGKEHGGINSTAYFKQSQQPTGNASERVASARSHMVHGHDAGGSSTLKDSPFVSTTGSLANLVLTDSPYNQMPHSKIVDYLIYGQRPGMPKVKINNAYQATKMAFIAVKEKNNPDDPHLFTPETIKAPPYEFCSLEDEHCIFAPATNLKECVLHEVENPFPDLIKDLPAVQHFFHRDEF